MDGTPKVEDIQERCHLTHTDDNPQSQGQKMPQTDRFSAEDLYAADDEENRDHQKKQRKYPETDEQKTLSCLPGEKAGCKENRCHQRERQKQAVEIQMRASDSQKEGKPP
jgi:hypothetical protein